ncbi:MAG: cysteine--tRNA ligase [Candidatus Dormibacteria bacterium]
MLRLYDTRTRQVRPLQPREAGMLRMYSCGPTVYRSVHIGNLRTYLLADWIKRAARQQGWRVLHVKNITDVGHMRQEMAERGGDKVIAAALAAGRTPAEIARQFEEEFHRSEAALGIEAADHFPRATEHVPQMLDLIQTLERRGLAYRAADAVYFDTAAADGYGALSGNSREQLQAAAAAEGDPAKRSPGDFTLWRLAEPGRQLMVWDSPYGRGFPGWHIECSAMAMAYLGEELDLHTGGVDNIFPHHEDELAQSHGATGGSFVRHWVHGQHVLADGVKMAKSQGNVYTLADLTARGFDPLAFRYLCAGTRYRTRLNFTLAALASAQRGLQRLRQLATASGGESLQPRLEELGAGVAQAFADDLDVPRALALVWRFAREPGLSPATRRAGILGADRLLGLGLDRPAREEAPQGEWHELARARQGERASARYQQADRLRVQLLDRLVVPEDGTSPSRYRSATALDLRHGLISSPAQVPDRRSQPDQADVTVSLVSSGYPQDLERCLGSVLRHRGRQRVEVLAVDNDGQDGVGQLLDRLAAREPGVRVFHADHRLGEGAARNVTLRAASGRVVLVLDTGVEVLGDCFSPLLQALEDPSVGAVGRWGARSRDLREFQDSQAREVDAIDGYCLGFARRRLGEVGLFDEGFRFYRMLDFNFCLALRARGLRQVRLAQLPVELHQHRGWEETDPEERERLSRLNFRRFYERWHHRPDLLLEPEPALPSPP